MGAAHPAPAGSASSSAAPSAPLEAGAMEQDSCPQQAVLPFMTRAAAASAYAADETGEGLGQGTCQPNHARLQPGTGKQLHVYVQAGLANRAARDIDIDLPPARAHEVQFNCEGHDLPPARAHEVQFNW